MSAATTTAAQNTFWRKLRQHIDGLPERFTPGKYPCPAHDDKGPSLKVDYRDNAVRIHCFSANCSGQTLMDRIGARWGDMSDYGPQVGGKLLGVFEYPDERGAPRLRAYRYTDPAGVRYQHFTPDGWVFGPAARGMHLLYRLPEVLAAMDAEERIFVVDDEQAADTLRSAGVVATTAAYRPPGKPWKRDYAEQLHGACVTVVACRHEAGRKHAGTLASLLDEADALWGAKGDGREGLRALLNAGYRRGATVPRVVGAGAGMTVQDFPSPRYRPCRRYLGTPQVRGHLGPYPWNGESGR